MRKRLYHTIPSRFYRYVRESRPFSATVSFLSIEMKESIDYSEYPFFNTHVLVQNLYEPALSI